MQQPPEMIVQASVVLEDLEGGTAIDNGEVDMSIGQCTRKLQGQRDSERDAKMFPL